MTSPSRFYSSIELLEARIAPAVVINNPLPDVVAGVGKTGATIDLSQLTAAASSSAYHTTVTFVTNYDTDPNTPGIQAGQIVMELYDNLAPLTVQNFLAYVDNPNTLADYAGTFFHRAVPGFVLQGGGYNTATPATHITTFVPVHNEPDTTNRSNLAGTVAMAKVGNDPNSATSEWFINLANNSANLDNQNGGFTVFGKVDAASLTLANTIANLPLANVGLGATTPEQNGHPITIESAIVTPHAPASTTGLTYTVQSITPTNGAPAGLVSAAVSGSKLTLDYGAGKSGTASVTVKVSDGTTSALDTFNVDVRPNFIVSVANDALPKFLVPGDTGTVKVAVSNNGGGVGSGTVTFYLLKQTVTKSSTGVITANSDLSPASQINLGIVGTAAFSNLGSGKTQTVPVLLKLPLDPFDTDQTVYRLVSQVTPANTALTSEELFSDDNKSLTNSLHEAVNEFGTLSDINFGTRANVVLHYNGKSAAGDAGLVTWTMKGSGSGTVVLDAQHLTASLTTQGTTIASSVTSAFSKTGAHLALTSISFNDAVGTVALGNANVSGLAVFSGGVKTLALGDLTNQALLLIGAVLPDTSTKGTITLGNVTDFSLESDMPLTSLTATSWHDTAGTAKDTITAPSIGTLKVNGDLEANVTLSDDLATTAITVAGQLHNSTITTAGNLGAVTLGAINTSSVFAGVTARPTSLSAFANPKTIASFNLTGYAGHTTNLFTNSQVAAQTIGSIKVKAVTPTGSGTYGFVADVIKSYARAAMPGHPAITRSNLTTPQVVDNLGNYEVQIL